MTVRGAQQAAPVRQPSRTRWIHGPAADTALALAWVPFAALAVGLREAPAARDTLLAAVLVLSFVHQPMTLPLVYLDPAERSARRRMLWLVPAALIAAIGLGLAVSLTIVAGVAAVWNGVHTMMQRYGVVRIYGRKAGETDAVAARVERSMLLTLLLLAVVWIAADPATPGRLRSIRLGTINTRGLEMLSELRPYALALCVPVGVVAALLAVRWIRTEVALRGAGAGNPAKHIYVALTVALFALVVVDPIAALIGFIASHAVEYMVLIHHALGSRYRAPGSGGMLGRAVRRGRHGPARVLLTCGAIALSASALFRTVGGQWTYTWLLLVVGGTHFVFDAVIWKLRRPAVAQSFQA